LGVFRKPRFDEEYEKINTPKERQFVMVSDAGVGKEVRAKKAGTLGEPSSKTGKQ